MEYVIRINDSAGESDPEPIILRLPPAAREKIYLRVVNLGEPTNLVLDADQSIARYIKPDRSNHYIVLEEIVPISVTMPDSQPTSGDLVLITDSGSRRIPVTLEPEVDEVREDEYRDDAEEPEGYDSDRDEYNERYNERYSDREGYADRDFYDKGDRWNGKDELIERYEPPRGYGIYTGEIVPAVSILVALIVLMILTFYTRSIPLFPGALATSMMIVSLIIYGTATLLRS